MFALEMATAQRTQLRALVGALRRAAWPLKSALHKSVSEASRTITFCIFFTIAGELFLYLQNGYDITIVRIEDNNNTLL